MKKGLDFNNKEEMIQKIFNYKKQLIILMILFSIVMVWKYALTFKTAWVLNLLGSNEAKQFTLECKKIGMDQEIDLATTDSTSEGLHTFKFCKDKYVYIKDTRISIYYRSGCDFPGSRRRVGISQCRPASVYEKGAVYPNNDSSQFIFKFYSTFWSGDMVTAMVKKNY